MTDHVLHERRGEVEPALHAPRVALDRAVEGVAEVDQLAELAGAMRCVLTWANGQPSVACYVRKPGDEAFRALALDVLRLQDGVVTEIVTFDGEVFARFGLPASLEASPL